MFILVFWKALQIHNTCLKFPPNGVYLFVMSGRQSTNILVAVVGITPQIITETAYALGTRSKPVLLDELRIITTSVGRERVEESLIRRGVLKKLTDEYNLKPLAINDDSFAMISDKAGRVLHDISDNDENEGVGNLITALIQELTNDPSTTLHCSIAGGRKTMGFYLGAALQLFGRPRDKLYHVLVSPEFESNRDFFFPPKRPAIIDSTAPDGSVKKLRTKNAKVRLAELPYIRLRDALSLEGKSFKELVRKGQGQMDAAVVQPELCVNLSGRTVKVGNHTLQMAPVLILFYTMLLLRKLENCADPKRATCQGCRSCFVEIGQLSSKESVGRMGLLLKRIFPNRMGKGEEFVATWKDGIRQETVRQYITKIRNEIERQAAGQPFVPFCTVVSNKKWGSSSYGITLERRNIKIL